jgi:hypothetical protein
VGIWGSIGSCPQYAQQPAPALGARASGPPWEVRSTSQAETRGYSEAAQSTVKRHPIRAGHAARPARSGWVAHAGRAGATGAGWASRYVAAKWETKPKGHRFPGPVLIFRQGTLPGFWDSLYPVKALLAGAAGDAA